MYPSSSLLVVQPARLLVLPIPKVASTLLKRVAVIAAGREPPNAAAHDETRPALAIHRPAVHGLPSLAELPPAEAQALLADPHAIRLGVTRHPGERLLSFWHDKLHLADPAYLPLNASVQESAGLDPALPCTFEAFVAFLRQHWHWLRRDGHLQPQNEWFQPELQINHRLDRSDLVPKLAELLRPHLTAQLQARLEQEIHNYNAHFRQRLEQRWPESYGAESLSTLQEIYGADLDAFGYGLPHPGKKRQRPLAPADPDALADPLQQLRDRNFQIAGLQRDLQQLQQELALARDALQRPPLPAVSPDPGAWPPHNLPEAGLSHLYEALTQQRLQEVIDLVTGLQGHPHAGEIAYLEGLAHQQLGVPERALRCFEAAQQQGFLTPYVLFNGGNCCRALGNPTEGLRLYRDALSQFPSFVECRHNLALALIELDQLQEAERELRLLLRDQPGSAAAAFTLANLLREHRREREAVEAYRLCLQFAPAYPDAWNNLGLAQAAIGETQAAMASYRHALSIDAAFRPSRQNLAQALMQDRQHQESLEHFTQLAQQPISPAEQVVALQGRINCLLELDRYDDALALADQAEDRRLQLMQRLHVLPILFHSEKQVSATRQRWHDDLADLLALLDGFSQEDPIWELLYSHAWSITNFYLAYQMEDDRPLQELYAAVLDRVLRPRLDRFMQPLPQRSVADATPIRVGLISAHLHNHNGSIWALGWLEGIAQRPDFSIYTYNIGDREDSGTERFAALGTYRYMPLRAENPEPALQQILDDQLDLLLYTDVGMHPASKVISVLQLAPVQALGWGHPITSGSTTIQYFFGADGMEPPGNEDHYSETLLRLPGTGLNYEIPVALHDGQRLYEAYDLPRERPLLLSTQSSFKYHPRNDWTFAEIAARHREALIILIGHMGHGSIAKRLHARLRPHFEHRGLDIDQHVRILPRLDYGDYMGLFAIAHHVIDTIDWNGGNSSLQAFSLDCPVLTCPTTYMRGRHTVAMLSLMDIPELVAESRDAYVETSVRLLQDGDFAASIRERIRERKHRLFQDRSVADAFRSEVQRITRPQASDSDPVPASGETVSAAA
ncbi:sulfotransferase family 2 domain-containing protein [Synechococcus sp. BA-120 BA3]|nr:sulfotransferase family 2 domain-containing protein [Synechococcus sp. BA-120 BA3]